MTVIPTSDQSVLRHANATQLEQAVADNHRQLFCLNALAVGGSVTEANGLLYTYTPANGANIPFPALAADAVRTQLDAMMDYYRAHQAGNIGCWSLDPATPADLGAYLLARGFQPGWRPCWMAMDLEAMPAQDAVPDGIVLKAGNDIVVREVKDLPYNDNNGAVSEALFNKHPATVQRFVAFRDGDIVGHCCLFFTTGVNGIAGMYNVGVLPSMRRKGIGKAVVLAACRYAKEHGYQYVMLNANDMGKPVYAQAGFQVVGYGLTWWIMNNRYITDPPAAAQVTLAETIGRGDIDTLQKLTPSYTMQMLNEPLANGMSLLQLATECRQPTAAEWLMQHGVVCTALDAWDLGWKDRAAALLAADPGEVNRRYYEWQGTLLHIAAQRNDIELAKLALQYKADLSIQDKEHGGIPIGWAYYFHRPEIIQLLKDQ